MTQTAVPAAPFTAIATLVRFWGEVVATIEYAVAGLNANDEPTILAVKNQGLIAAGRYEVTVFRVALQQAWLNAGLSEAEKRMVLLVLTFDQGGEAIPAIFPDTEEHFRALLKRIVPNADMLPRFTRAVRANQWKRGRGAVAQLQTFQAIMRLPRGDWPVHVWLLANSALRKLLAEVIEYDQQQHRGMLESRARSEFTESGIPDDIDYLCLLVYVVARIRLGKITARRQ